MSATTSAVTSRHISRQLNLHLAGAAKQIERLSSGSRLNRASDDPAAVALTGGINAEVRAYAEGGRNVQQSISMLQVADSALGQMSDMVRRMAELAAQAASSTYTDADRVGANQEFMALRDEIQRVAVSTTYNGLPLLTDDAEFITQAGPTGALSDIASIRFDDMRASGPRLALGTVTIDNRDVARQAISVVNQALDQVTEVRTRVGAYQNRLDKVATTAASAIEDMVSTQSAIGDTDMAQAIGSLTRSQILAEAAASMGRQSGGDVERLLGLLR